MKKINVLFILLAAMFALTWTSCSDEVEYTPAGAVEGQGAYFAPTTVTNYDDLEASGSITLDVMRTYADATAEVSLSATYSEGADLFTVPSTVSFAADSLTSTVTLNYNNLVRGTTYTVTLSLGESTPYGQSEITLTLLYPEEVLLKWEVVSENAVLTDNLFSAFNLSDVTITGIVVEKEVSTNMYRFRSPYNNDYFETYVTGTPNFFGDMEMPYIVLDGETYADAGYYIAPTALGFVMVNGVGPSVNPTWNTFGSVAGNLSTADGLIQPGNASYPLGSFDETKKMFDLGSCYFNFDYDANGEDYFYPMSPGAFQLWLDPAMMETDYDRDYTWVDVPEAAGLFTSEMAGQSWVQAVQVAEEDSTFYRFPNLYAGGEKNHLYFYLDTENDNMVSIPSGQNWVGLTSFGQTVWVEGTRGSSYDPETDQLTLALNLYLADEDGNKLFDLNQFTETFLWGQPSEFVEADITDYVGNWVVPFDNGNGAQSILVNITQEGDAALKVQGLSGLDPASYDDTMFLDYDASNGQVVFSFQQVADVPTEEGFYMGVVAPYDYTTNMLGRESLIGGLTRSGILKFTDAPTNEGTYNSMIYLMTDGQGFGMLTGYWNYLEWEPYTDTASTKSLMKFEAPKTFKPTLKQGFTPRRTYKTELNIQPKPVEKRSAVGSKSVVLNNNLPTFNLTRR